MHFVAGTSYKVRFALQGMSERCARAFAATHVSMRTPMAMSEIHRIGLLMVDLGMCCSWLALAPCAFLVTHSSMACSHNT